MKLGKEEGLWQSGKAKASEKAVTEAVMGEGRRWRRLRKECNNL